MLRHVEVPTRLQRNAPVVIEAGVEHTGQHLISLATELAGFEDLADVDILDVGCGTRFAQTIVNRGMRIGSYTGLEVNEPVIDFLKREIEAHDDRFRFEHWNVYHQSYHAEGPRLASEDQLPVEGTFDLIWLFSVFTHLDDQDAPALLSILRRHVQPEGKLFFSAFIDAELDGFEDRTPGRPLHNAYFGKRTMEAMIEEAGWSIDLFRERNPDDYIMDHFMCSPA